MLVETKACDYPDPNARFRYSVVVPVYNEAENIRPLLTALRERLPLEYEILVVYDFDGDTTLPAIDKIPASERPTVLRTVRNDLGPGVRYAIEKGMRSAASPIVLVTMADLSDDYSAVAAMIRLAEGGADIVCASRYMSGGRQIGGPFLKGVLSRIAGLTLHWFVGLPTHDATNSFRAYRKDFLDKTRIESSAGFALGLELTVKAHAAGRQVVEVPATWTDRCAGASRFRILSWLPEYLRWYFWAFRHRRSRKHD